MTQGFTQTNITSGPAVSSGIVAPATTPNRVGDQYIDTVAKRTYIATGTSSSADWKKQAVFSSGTATISSGDVTITLPWDWSGGHAVIHVSASTSNYFNTTGDVARYETSYESLTNAGYTDKNNLVIEPGTSPSTIIKTSNVTGMPKSATSTTLVLNDQGTDKYIKWFVWA